MQRRTFNKLLGAAILANAFLPFDRVNATNTSSANSNPHMKATKKYTGTAADFADAGERVFEQR